MTMKPASGIRGLIFDLDGTLADTMPVHYRAWEEVASDNGFVYPEDLFYELAGVPTSGITEILNEKFGLDLDIESVVCQKEEAYLKRIGEVRAIEPVVRIVLDNYGKIPMSIGTGGRKRFAWLTLKAIGLEKYFDILVSADDVNVHKPAPDTFLKCAELMGISPEYCLVYEDGDAGIRAASAACMRHVDVRLFL